MKWSFLPLLALFLLTTSVAQAAPKRRSIAPDHPNLIDIPDHRYRAGITLGLGIPTADDFGSSRLLAGADFYIVHDDAIDFGVSYLTGGDRVKMTGRRWRGNFAGAEVNFKKPQVALGFYLGAAAGVVSFDGGDAFLPGIDNLYVGPKLGFYRMITRDLSWGMEAKALFVTSSPLLVWIDALASMHYHF